MGQRPDRSMCYITLYKLLGWYSCIKISNTCHALFFPKENKQYLYIWGIFSTEKVTKLGCFPYQILNQLLKFPSNSPCVHNFTWNFSWVIKSNWLTQTFQSKLKTNVRSCAYGGVVRISLEDWCFDNFLWNYFWIILLLFKFHFDKWMDKAFNFFVAHYNIFPWPTQFRTISFFYK